MFMTTNYFSKTLVDLMDERDLYQQELATAIDMRQSQISNLLRGKSLPSYYTIKKLSDFFNISADALVDTKFDD